VCFQIACVVFEIMAIAALERFLGCVTCGVGMTEHVAGDGLSFDSFLLMDLCITVLSFLIVFIVLCLLSN